ncbi:YggT family protein [Halothiobacillus sp. DCM-1]|uniref:YggT family protein n=1 Tax=Halothiobacillus sp. DCM-1 TaxID=3112558 RepID=UPI003246523C
MNGQFGDPLLFLVRALFDLAIFVVLLRYFLQLFRGNFFNPLTQSIVRMTDPVLRPLRRLLPHSRRHDFAALLVTGVLIVVMVVVLAAMSGKGMPGGGVLVLSALYFGFLSVTNLFFWTVLLRALSSWLGNSGSPAVALLADLTAPLLQPVQRILPPLGGLDLSPLVVLLGIQVLQMVVGNLLFG